MEVEPSTWYSSGVTLPSHNPAHWLLTSEPCLCSNHHSTWAHLVRLRSTLAQAMVWCWTAPSHHLDQHWHLITDIDQHWPRPWHVTWQHQATTQDQCWDITTGICQHCPIPWPVTLRCQASTWANAEITYVNPLANAYGSFDISTRGTSPWDQPEKYI